MPWCPKCKNEFQEGYTVCSDCKAELVEELSEVEEYIPFFQSEAKSIAEKLSKYFAYSELKSVIRYNEELEVYIVYVPSDLFKKAQKLYQAFYFVERDLHEQKFTSSDQETAEDANGLRVSEAEPPVEEADKPAKEGAMKEEPSENTLPGDTDHMKPGKAFYTDSWNEEIPEEEAEEEEVEEMPEPGAYVLSSEKYKDYTATVSVFLGVGILGILFVILNIAGVLTILNSPLSIVVMGALFLGFIYIALSTNKKAGELKLLMAEEKKSTELINQWLKEHVTAGYLAALNDDSLSEELNYIRKTEAVKNLLMTEFPDQNTAYLDRLIEEYYNANFEAGEIES